MTEFLSSLREVWGKLGGEGVGWVVLRTAIIIVLGVSVAKLLGSVVGRLTTKRTSQHKAIIFRRLAYYGVMVLVFLAVLRSVGVKLTVLLGAAGILTVALGFAAQTSASNIISGLFLLGERPFEVGDVIKVGERVGQVLSVDMLSVKLRTFDNLFVRIPNETLLKTELVNMTRHPIRRLDMPIGVAYKEDATKVKKVLMEVADSHPLVLDEPKPTFLFLGFGESSLNLQFSVWVSREKYWEVMAPIKQKVKDAIQEAGIEIPFPHRTLYAGSVTDPFPVRVMPPGDPLETGAPDTVETPDAPEGPAGSDLSPRL